MQTFIMERHFLAGSVWNNLLRNPRREHGVY